MHEGKNDEEWREANNNLHLRTYQPDSEAERKLVRKVDLHIVCVCFLICQASSVLLPSPIDPDDLGVVYLILP
jgi:hypothetical protein